MSGEDGGAALEAMADAAFGDDDELIDNAKNVDESMGQLNETEAGDDSVSVTVDSDQAIEQDELEEGSGDC